MIELLLEAERALSFGLVDRAETLYQQVADADPRNSIAVVGLARIALEHADDAGALVLARRALAIDPENEAARRLVERMEEVMRTRGEALPPAEATPVEGARDVAREAPIQPPSTTPSAPATPAQSPAKRSWRDRLLRR